MASRRANLLLAMPRPVAQQHRVPLGTHEYSLLWAMPQEDTKEYQELASKESQGHEIL